MLSREAEKINYSLGNKTGISQRGHPRFDSEHNITSDWGISPPEISFVKKFSCSLNLPEGRMYAQAAGNSNAVTLPIITPLEQVSPFPSLASPCRYSILHCHKFISIIPFQVKHSICYQAKTCTSIDSVTQSTVGQGSKLNKFFITPYYSAVTPGFSVSIDQETQITAWGLFPSFFPQHMEKNIWVIVVL